MSHFTKIQTQVTNLEIMQKVLDNLDYKYVFNTKIRAWRGTRKVDFAIDIGSKYAIGLNKNSDGVYEAIADWDIIGRKSWNQIIQNYSVEIVKQQAILQGYEVTTVEAIENNEIRVVISGWA